MMVILNVVTEKKINYRLRTTIRKSVVVIRSTKGFLTSNFRTFLYLEIRL